jgi:hypothetical protein
LEDRKEPQLYDNQPLHRDAAKGIKPEVVEGFMKQDAPANLRGRMNAFRDFKGR